MFSTEPVEVAGFEALEIYRGGFRQDRASGLLLKSGGRLRGRFRSLAMDSARLRFQHRSLAIGGPGFSAFKLTIDGRVVAQHWEPPWWTWGREDSFEDIPIGALSAGLHSFELTVVDQTLSHYSLTRLELRPSDD